MIARTSVMLIVLMLAAMLAACSSGDDAAEDLARSVSEPSAGEMDYDEVAEEEAYALDESDADAAQISIPSDRRVIRSGELDLAVSDVSAATRQARETVADRGGHVASSTSRTLSEDRERADITFEVPSDQYENVMSALSDGSHVVRVEHESTSSQDVTEEYVDLESRLTNLQSTEARFVELLEEAHSIADVLSVENEISRVRGEIERIQGRLNYLDQRTSYSSIYVSFELDEDGTMTVAGQNFAPGESAREAWNASMQFIGTVGNALITVVVFFWWGWPLLGLAIFGLMHVRRRRQPVAAS